MKQVKIRHVKDTSEDSKKTSFNSKDRNRNPKKKKKLVFVDAGREEVEGEGHNGKLGKGVSGDLMLPAPGDRFLCRCLCQREREEREEVIKYLNFQRKTGFSFFYFFGGFIGRQEIREITETCAIMH